MTEGQKRPFHILVIGDWVVDDNWVIGRHSSEQSQSAGRAHYNSLHHAGSLVRQVNAAGRVAAFLHAADWETETQRECHIRGIGVWHDNDTDYLKGMFIPANMTGSNPYRVVGPDRRGKEVKGIDLFNFGQCLDRFGVHNFGPSVYTEGDSRKANHEDPDDVYYGTTRVYRVFDSSGPSQLDQLSRVDWELPPRHEDGDGNKKDVSWLPPGAKQGSGVWNVTRPPVWKQPRARKEGESGPQIAPPELLMAEGTTRQQVVEWLRKAMRGKEGTIKIEAVVVKDNGKGVMTRQLIDLLFEAYPELETVVPWFVASKKWEPVWLSHLIRTADVRAVVFQQAATREKAAVNTWVSGQGYVTSEAARLLEVWARRLKLCDKEGTRTARRLVMVMPDRFRALARVSEAHPTEPENPDKTVLLQPKPNPENVNTEMGVGLGSAVLSALVYGLLRAEHFNDPSRRGKPYHSEPPNRLVGTRFLVGGALRFAQRWVDDNYKWLTTSRLPATGETLMLKLNAPTEANRGETCFAIRLGKREAGGAGGVAPQDLNEVGHTDFVPRSNCLTDPAGLSEPLEAIITLLEVIKEPVTEGGVTKVVDKRRAILETGRGDIELKGYVCCVPSKRKVVADLSRRFREYKSHTGRYTHAMAGLLLARPGSGKSHLVKTLARTVGLELLTINVSNLNRREDLLSEFDRVVTAQADLRSDDRLLVFVDEVNATIEGRPVYDAFLTPLEDGYYVRGGLRFHIKPCQWLFVGTGDEAAIQAAAKGSDFVSRMTLESLDMRGDPSDDTYLAMQENLLVGVSKARRDYPELRELHKGVLIGLAELPPTTSLRDISHLIETELEVSRTGQGNWRSVLNVGTDATPEWKSGGIVKLTNRSRTHAEPRWADMKGEQATARRNAVKALQTYLLASEWVELRSAQPSAGPSG